MPIRIQRQRTKGWRMPPNTVYVGRGSVWGNPFVVGQDCGVFLNGTGMQGKDETLMPKITLEQSIELYRELVSGYVKPEMYPFGHDWMQRMHKWCIGHPSDNARGFLRGKNLACWCALVDKDERPVPCHADVLLEIANR